LISIFFIFRVFSNKEKLYPISPDFLSVVKNDFVTLESISKKNLDKMRINENTNKRGPYGTLSEQLYQIVCIITEDICFYLNNTKQFELMIVIIILIILIFFILILIIIIIIAIIILIIINILILIIFIYIFVNFIRVTKNE
jgi:hypothetical protein